MKKLKEAYNLITNKEFTTKITIYFGYKTAGDDYDPYEKSYTYTDLNPVTIKAYVTELSPEALVWKQYGLKEIGAKEIITKEKYSEWFRIADRVVIDNDEYEVMKDGVGSRSIISHRPYKMIRVVLNKK